MSLQKGTKIALWIVSIGGLVTAVAFTIRAIMKPSTTATANPNSGSTSGTSTSPQNAYPQNTYPPPKNYYTPYVPPKPTSNSSYIPSSSGISMGSKIYANSSSGVNAYKSASAGVNNIYKFYHDGDYIGTFLGTDGIFYKVITDKNNIFGLGTSSVTVWVISNQVKS